MRKALAVVGALAIAFGLGGCNLVGSSPKPTASSTAPSALASLVPAYPAKLTAAKAKSGTIAAADAIQALIASTEIVHVDDHAELVAATKTTGAYYAVGRAVTTTKGFDVITQGQAMEKLLIQAGWIERQASTTTTGYMVAMSTYTDAGVSVLELIADETAGTPAGIELELESPDLPKD